MCIAGSSPATAVMACTAIRASICASWTGRYSARIARASTCCARAPEMTTDTEAPTLVPEAGHLILVDGSGYIFRAFHALPMMTRADGTPVNAVFGFTNMLARFLKDHVGTHLAV